MLTIKAPAKINLTLEVLGKREDDYHEIRSVIQAITLCDVLHMQVAKAIEITANREDWDPEKSLIPRAIRLLQDASGYSKGVNISVEKHIPFISGLGGESSDAAAALCGLKELWELELTMEELSDMAASLGSDIPFFLNACTALAEGRGEKLTRLPPLPPHWVVLLVPAVGRLPGKTEQMYKSLKPSHFTDGEITLNLVNALNEQREIDPSMLFNTFENLFFQRRSDVETHRKHFERLGAENIHLAGSGPTLFTLIKDKAAAEELYARLQSENLESYLAETVSG